MQIYENRARRRFVEVVGCRVLACLASTVVATQLAASAQAKQLIWLHDATAFEVTRYANDWFGTALAVDGDTLLVGAKGSNGHGFQLGEVHVYQSFSGSWQWVDSLGPVNPSSTEFGRDVALSGDHALVKSWNDQGSVVDFFHRTQAGWAAVGQLQTTYGLEFTLAGDRAAVADASHLRVLEWTGSTWEQKSVFPQRVSSLAIAGNALLAASSDDISVLEFGRDTWRDVGRVELSNRSPHTLVADDSTAVYEDVLLERGEDGVWNIRGSLLAEAGLEAELAGPDDPLGGDIVPALTGSRITLYFDGQLAEFERQQDGAWEFTGSLCFVGDDLYGVAVARVDNQVLVGNPQAHTMGFESGVVHVYERDERWEFPERLLPDHSTEALAGCSIASPNDSNNGWAAFGLGLLFVFGRTRRRRSTKVRGQQLTAVIACSIALWLGTTEVARACSTASPAGVDVDASIAYLDAQPLPTNGVILVPAHEGFWQDGLPEDDYELQVWDGDTQIPGHQSIHLVDHKPPVADRAYSVRFVYTWKPDSDLSPNHSYELRVVDPNGWYEPALEYGFVTAGGPATGLAGELQVELTPGVDVAEVVEEACCELGRSSCGVGSFCIATTERYEPILTVSATVPGLSDPRMVRLWVARLTPDGSELPSESWMSEEADIDYPVYAEFPTLPLGQIEQQVMFPGVQSEYCVVVGATSMIDGQSTKTTACVSHSPQSEAKTTTLDTPTILAQFEEFEANANGQGCLSPVLYRSNGEAVEPEQEGGGCRVAQAPGHFGWVWLVALALVGRRRVG